MPARRTPEEDSRPAAVARSKSGGVSSPSPWLPYFAPITAFSVFKTLEDLAPTSSYPYLYMVKILTVTALLVHYRDPWADIRPSIAAVIPSVLVGLAVFAEWILLDRWLAYPHLGTRTAFDPFSSIEDPTLRVLFLLFRFSGLALVVPIMEEIFWRSFLLRYLTDVDFKSIPLGGFSSRALFLVSLAFGLAHPEWLAALICALAYGLLLRRTGSLFGCIVAHSISNLALGIYILSTGSWSYW